MEYCRHLWVGGDQFSLSCLYRVEKHLRGLVGNKSFSTLQQLSQSPNVTSVSSLYNYFYEMSSDESDSLVPPALTLQLGSDMPHPSGRIILILFHSQHVYRNIYKIYLSLRETYSRTASYSTGSLVRETRLPCIFPRRGKLNYLFGSTSHDLTAGTRLTANTRRNHTPTSIRKKNST